VNGIGNLVARVMKLAEEHLSEPVTIEPLARDSIADLITEEFKFSEALDMVFKLIAQADERMTSSEPYKKIKNPETADEAREEITALVKQVANIAQHLKWAMPDTSAEILKAIAENKKPENLFPRLAV
jgi:methionyl-tRNA synthetase